jgi:hypothetical protein
MDGAWLSSSPSVLGWRAPQRCKPRLRSLAIGSQHRVRGWSGRRRGAGQGRACCDGPVQTQRASEIRLAADWLKILVSRGLTPPLYSASSVSRTPRFSFRKMLAHLPNREPWHFLLRSRFASPVRNIRFPLLSKRYPTSLTKLRHMSGPASWLVFFRRAQRRRIYSSVVRRSSTF